MASNDPGTPVFLKWFYPASEGEHHVFVRSDWIMDFLFENLSHEDAMRTWTLMCASRILAEEGEDAAQEFLGVFGIPEH